MIRAVKRKDARAVAEYLGNRLESVTIPRHPVIEDRKQALYGCGAEGVLMSGSGPTVFGIFFDREQQSLAYEALRGMEGIGQIYMAEPVADIRD
jgi:4-diphosphocytidyl-2-C-methyl-D-erythritol kinase